MRLLNIYTLKFQEFFESQIPPYFILSHRWGRDEISYEEFCRDQPPDKAGYHKVLSFCKFVRQRREALGELLAFGEAHGSQHIKTSDSDKRLDLAGSRWVWVDTCCIDKRSSAELSEAINSMFNWYKNAYECIVLLNDVPSWQELGMASPYHPGERNGTNGYLVLTPDEQLKAQRDPGWLRGVRHRLGDAVVDMICQSAWHRRGWTLQELLAPKQVTFCNANFEILGHVCKLGMHCRYSLYGYGLHINELLSSITKIPVAYLSGMSLSNASLAQRLSWASQRRTTRTEDEAYCLLGIFNVNMPLLYGEGHGAFRRLQLEIIQKSTDQSVFAWIGIPQSWEEHLYSKYVSILAPIVALFADSSGIEKSPIQGQNAEYAITNRGLRLEIETFLPPQSIDQKDRCIRLNCIDSKQGDRRVVLHLSGAGDQFIRSMYDSQEEEFREEDLGHSCGREKIYVYTGVED